MAPQQSGGCGNPMRSEVDVAPLRVFLGRIQPLGSQRHGGGGAWSVLRGSFERAF